jgi:hypothetical protein
MTLVKQIDSVLYIIKIHMIKREVLEHKIPEYKNILLESQESPKNQIKPRKRVNNERIVFCQNI